MPSNDLLLALAIVAAVLGLWWAFRVWYEEGDAGGLFDPVAIVVYMGMSRRTWPALALIILAILLYLQAGRV